MARVVIPNPRLTTRLSGLGAGGEANTGAGAAGAVGRIDTAGLSDMAAGAGAKRDTDGLRMICDDVARARTPACPEGGRAGTVFFTPSGAGAAAVMVVVVVLVGGLEEVMGGLADMSSLGRLGSNWLLARASVPPAVAGGGGGGARNGSSCFAVAVEASLVVAGPLRPASEAIPAAAAPRSGIEGLRCKPVAGRAGGTAEVDTGRSCEVDRVDGIRNRVAWVRAGAAGAGAEASVIASARLRRRKVNDSRLVED